MLSRFIKTTIHIQQLYKTTTRIPIPLQIQLLPSFGFPPENTRILYDGNPCSAKRNARNTDPESTPSKDNLIFQLRWLVKDSFPGDVLFFFYSGFGLLVDDSCGYDGEGLEEAILPSDAESVGRFYF